MSSVSLILNLAHLELIPHLPVIDNAFSKGLISSDLIGVSFEPTTSETSTNGELTFGGTDSSKFTGSITFTPVTSTSPASFYWGINQSVKYGTTTISSSTAGIVDTGTTLLYLASDAFSKYQSATGATLDNATGLLKISSANFSKLQNLVFTIGGTTFTLTPNAQIWPVRSLPSDVGDLVLTMWARCIALPQHRDRRQLERDLPHREQHRHPHWPGTRFHRWTGLSGALLQCLRCVIWFFSVSNMF